MKPFKKYWEILRPQSVADFLILSVVAVMLFTWAFK